MDASLTFESSLQTTREFYESHRRWLLAQLALIGASAAAGILIGLLLQPAAGIAAGVVLTVASGLVGVFVIPAWRTKVEERQQL